MAGNWSENKKHKVQNSIRKITNKFAQKKNQNEHETKTYIDNNNSSNDHNDKPKTTDACLIRVEVFRFRINVEL